MMANDYCIGQKETKQERNIKQCTDSEDTDTRGLMGGEERLEEDVL
jgi:hypothetical protein